MSYKRFSRAIAGSLESNTCSEAPHHHGGLPRGERQQLVPSGAPRVHHHYSFALIQLFRKFPRYHVVFSLHKLFLQGQSYTGTGICSRLIVILRKKRSTAGPSSSWRRGSLLPVGHLANRKRSGAASVWTLARPTRVCCLRLIASQPHRSHSHQPPRKTSAARESQKSRDLHFGVLLVGGGEEGGARREGLMSLCFF
ncbi:hypothetical protein E2C01_047689 [Portunus trituberculatus]|uniref:Uncharacterized protein n=1 Tax=Portunus trituberculatus TaxID=210409 RepID=A0A5B7G863_PORTR|nr:hypothetical protein [Portunus trituberculatus]